MTRILAGLDLLLGLTDEAVEFAQKFRHACSISGDQSGPRISRMVPAITPKKSPNNFAWRAIGIVRLHLAFDHAEVAAASPAKSIIASMVERQHRTFYEIASLAPEHRLGFRMFAKKATIDSRRQILAALGGQFEAVLDQIGWCRHMPCSIWAEARCEDVRDNRTSGSRLARYQKKEQGASPALKIVSTLFPRKIGFDLD